MEQTECPETSVHKIQTLGNHPEERTKIYRPSIDLEFPRFLCDRKVYYILKKNPTAASLNHSTPSRREF